MSAPTDTSVGNVLQESNALIENNFTTINGRPVPKEPLSFFQYKKGNRLIINIADSVQTWVDDLPLAEKLFGDMVICPFQSDPTLHSEKLSVIQDVLKQRMKYPGVKESPELQKIAKTWILPQKLHIGPSANTWLGITQEDIHRSLAPIFTALDVESMIHVLKIEVANGRERSLLYSLLDCGFRPSLILVKWGFDMDDHSQTAHCAGHVMNSGYSLVSFNEGYALYMFTEQTLYDICSMKKISIQNPILGGILESATEHLRTPTTNPSSSILSSTRLEAIPEGSPIGEESINSSS